MSDPESSELSLPPILPAILVVEDDPHFSELVARILSPRYGFDRVLVAQSLSQAMASLKSQPFGLIFQDLNLTDSRGMETLSRIIPLVQGAQILVMTGEADEEKALQAMREGAHDYLVKGHHSPDALRRVARYALERYTAGRELRQFRALLSESMDALPASIAILDSKGKIVITNSRWRHFQDPGNRLIHACSEGTNYLKVVEQFWQPETNADGCASEIISQFLKVLSGQLDQYSLDYVASLNSGKAWSEMVCWLSR